MVHDTCPMHMKQKWLRQSHFYRFAQGFYLFWRMHATVLGGTDARKGGRIAQYTRWMRATPLTRAALQSCSLQPLLTLSRLNLKLSLLEFGSNVCHHDSISLLLKVGWVFFERMRVLSGIQFIRCFIDFAVVGTNQIVNSNSNVILTWQTCGLAPEHVCGKQTSSARKWFSCRIWYMFLLSKCRRDSDSARKTNVLWSGARLMNSFINSSINELFHQNIIEEEDSELWKMNYILHPLYRLSIRKIWPAAHLFHLKSSF